MAWSSDSWQGFEARQQPDYPDAAALAAATRELEAYPPLVRLREIDGLRAALAEAQAGRAFLLQGGDCAESFAEFSPANIAAIFALFAAMARRLGAASGVPVIRLGRLAGQFAKPRSAPVERQGDIALPAYRGDIVNQIGFDAGGRRPDPERMFRAYAQAAATLSHLETLAAADGTAFHASHEALLLPFEQALVRRDGRFYAASMPAPPTSSGSASAPCSRARPMSSSSAASPIRSGSNAGPASPPMRCCGCSTGSTPKPSRAGSP